MKDITKRIKLLWASLVALVLGKEQIAKTDKCLKDFSKRKVELEKIVATNRKLVPQLKTKKDEDLLITKKVVQRLHSAYDKKIKKLNDERFTKSQFLWDASRKRVRSLNGEIKEGEAEIIKARKAIQTFENIV